MAGRQFIDSPPDLIDNVAEIWRPVCGYEWLYSVSNYGRIRRDVPDTAGTVGRILKPSIDSHGYHRYTLTKSGVQFDHIAHRLVLLTFVGAPPLDKPETRHLDGKPGNNYVGNLCWGTRKEQAEDQRRHGTVATGDRHGTKTKPECIPRGEKRAFAKLTETDVVEILRRLKAGERLADVTRRFPVCRRAIEAIRDGTRWKHVPRP